MYITALKAISPQPTYDESFLQGNNTVLEGNKYKAQEPDYMGLINPNLLRRMGKSIRVGIGAGFPLMQQKKVDAIILGSSEGGLEDCIKFLNQIVQYNEGTLTPTNFVQSTPNALAGSLALMDQNTCYNATHVHKGQAFENALIDTLTLLKEGKAQAALVGNVEEISDYNFNVEKLAGYYKAEATTSETLLTSNTPGSVCGEGSCMFIVQSEAKEYFARIVDVEQISFPTEDDIIDLINETLSKNKLTPNDIDALVLGYNGDSRTDFWYSKVEAIFPDQSIYTFKNLVGEFPSSMAFAMYMSTHILASSKEFVKPKRPSSKSPKRILIYNHYKGEQHGLILLSKE